MSRNDLIKCPYCGCSRGLKDLKVEVVACRKCGKEIVVEDAIRKVKGDIW